MAAAQLPFSLSVDEILKCAIPNWYERFRNVTFKSEFVSLPKDFIDYLRSDGLVLPDGCSLPSHLGTCASPTDGTSDETVWDEDDPEDVALLPSFPDLIEKVTQSIHRLGGAVFPKLNWSAPRDAIWIAPGNSLKCICPGEVILLLKSSNFIAHDLSRVCQYCQPDPQAFKPEYTLCLRKWKSIYPSGEFRCFVRDNQMIGVSQRDCSSYYEHVAALKTEIWADIVTFFQQAISGKFPSSNYVFDVYRSGQGRVTLVDFNPYSPMTDSLLFSWEELLGSDAMGDAAAATVCPGLRVIECPTGVQPSSLHSMRLPQDMVDLSCGEDIHKLMDLLAMPRQEDSRGEDCQADVTSE